MDDRTGAPPDRSTKRTKSKQRSLDAAVILMAVLIGLLVAVVGLGPRLIARLVPQPVPATLELEDRTAPEKLAALRALGEARLNAYGWVDKEAGIAHIPINRAMALLVESGLPVGVPTPAAGAASTPAIDPASVSFARDVLPIFVEHCSECHGEDDPEEGLQLTTYRTVMLGSFYGAVVKPGDVEGSYLAEMITTGQMPKRGGPLTPTEIATILAWIKAGAPDN